MGLTLAEKIIFEHLLEGTLERGNEIAIKIDQTLTQDATGTLVYLALENIGIKKVKTEISVSYIDHNTLQTDFKNADDHLYLKDVANNFGILLSKPGNGICHQLHLERFAKPGKTLVGSDSHTPTSGGVGCLGFGAGGLDVASAMAGFPIYLEMPKILGVNLSGKLNDFVSAKDVILELLRRIDVKGAKGYIIEYFGDGVKNLSVTERATISNMGTETGATSSIFPSDKTTKKFLKMQKRGEDFKKLEADKNCEYDKTIEINLGEIEPLVTLPHSPGNVVPVKEVEGVKVNQVCIGSCTNSSYRDLMVAASLLKGKKIHEDVSLVISPGSRQVLKALAKNGALATLIEAGARVLEPSCGPCIGMGQAPPTSGVSVRTYNRNFPGRSGTKDAKVYLVSPETAVATAITGILKDPREMNFEKVNVKEPTYEIDFNLFVYPKENKVKIRRGPNIKPIPIKEPLNDELSGEVLIKLGDNISTDEILPAGAKILPLRSNIPAISEFVFSNVDKDFVKMVKEKGGGFIVAGENYGQGSSREHAALAPMYLGIKSVIAKSFSRIHEKNLINFGILPLTFSNVKDYEKISFGDVIKINGIRKFLERGDEEIKILNVTKKVKIDVKCKLIKRYREILLAGGILNYIREKVAG